MGVTTDLDKAIYRNGVSMCIYAHSISFSMQDVSSFIFSFRISDFVPNSTFIIYHHEL